MFLFYIVTYVHVNKESFGKEAALCGVRGVVNCAFVREKFI